ncbi:hypothetical protein G7Z17_g3044 [Cylindrodendrum hubeiense]|uniref:CBM-cenC domain-containing protein n=1 Tax=Cylindrodendrum hubeiense TaxID=595255 RepID=A0A9P5LDW1_9HYPO|nr:hypothetical protein G7Z17_g3044 [Cylindrodendrum hubeiense]
MRYFAIAVAALSVLRVSDASPCKAPTTGLATTESTSAADITSSTTADATPNTTVDTTSNSTPTSTDSVIYNEYPDYTYSNGLGDRSKGAVAVIDSQGGLSAEANGDDDADNEPLAKRAATGSASIGATLTNLEVGTSYTVLFYYAVSLNDVALTCRVRSSLGTDNYFNSAYFPDVITAGSPVTWVTVAKAVTATAATENIVFALTCKSGGHASIYLNRIFITNKATPENIEQVVKNYNNDPASTPTSTSASISASTVSSAAVSSADTSSVSVNSDSTTASSSAQSSTESVSAGSSTESASAGSSTESVSAAVLYRECLYFCRVFHRERLRWVIHRERFC